MLKNAGKFLSIIALVSVSGCASYRTDNGTTFSSTTNVPTADLVLISQDSLPGRKYRAIGPVEAEVKKLTAFHKDPTKEQVNVVLSQNASKIGADAVVNVTYKEGIGMMTWGYIEAKGVGVKLSD